MKKEIVETIIKKLPTSIKIEGDWATREVRIDGKYLSPKHSQKVHNHSPDGFNWSYGGSGPAQLALAILLKYLSEEEAQQCYHSFKFGFIAGLPKTDFIKTINLQQVLSDILLKEDTIC